MIELQHLIGTPSEIKKLVKDKHLNNKTINQINHISEGIFIIWYWG